MKAAAAEEEEDRMIMFLSSWVMLVHSPILFLCLNLSENNLLILFNGLMIEYYLID